MTIFLQTKAFAGVQGGSFLEKSPLAAGGKSSTRSSGWTSKKFLSFFSFYVHPVDTNSG